MKTGRTPLKQLTDVYINYDGDDSGVEWYSDEEKEKEEEKNAEDIDQWSDGSDCDNARGTKLRAGMLTDVDDAEEVDMEDLEADIKDGWLVSPDDPEFGDREFQENMKRAMAGDVANSCEYPFYTINRQRGDYYDDPIIIDFIPLSINITSDMRNRDASLFVCLFFFFFFWPFKSETQYRNPQVSRIVDTKGLLSF
ncbi:hypothetical protein RFI_20165 [Reticulomyxa filosa]|uniref:Uncharacterized protein n=1 Tax=Reticulomyxa filosa TaxID=46433 RepID=X6MVN2_RETFI|nr:hypothetical protein RFI_20165 [Reticulomyxa filosa]|eukprot:ETO17165.1 hypothetical protein RFI_20165 [Reticulomyxa filosa]